jgi:methylenetetrahydrofolate dehydrogenase (NADP+)/methenyltetrahydrofolate cyclohydrolase
MTTEIIKGSAIAKELRVDLKGHVQELIARGITPQLGVILVGGFAPSQIYVKYKTRAADEIGIKTVIHRFPPSVTLSELYACVDEMNADPLTHGILVQLPLPDHLSAQEAWSVVERVDPRKDVDGLHPINLGRIGVTSSPEQGLSSGFIACTPLGCLTLLQRTIGDLSGKRAVVIGRSRIVGRPMAALLNAANATVTICHSRTRELSDHLKHAEIVIAAAGVPGLIKRDMLSSEAVVLDVGIHRLDDGSLCGDVALDVRGHVRAISPVPGGVGPMTIASLMSNVHLAALRQSRSL